MEVQECYECGKTIVGTPSALCNSFNPKDDTLHPLCSTCDPLAPREVSDNDGVPETCATQIARDLEELVKSSCGFAYEYYDVEIADVGMSGFTMVFPGGERYAVKVTKLV